MPLERERVEETLFDWRTWRLAASEPAGLRLLWAAIRQATARWVDSQLWLVERNAAWINQAEPGDSTPLNAAAPTAGLVEHLAAQLVVALKPFAGNLVTSVQ